MLKTDSVQLKKVICSEEYDLSALGTMFKEIKYQLHVGFSEACVVNCPRAYNLVAHRLAAFSASLNFDECVTWLGHLPEFVLNFVAGDLPSNDM